MASRRIRAVVLIATLAALGTAALGFRHQHPAAHPPVHRLVPLPVAGLVPEVNPGVQETVDRLRADLTRATGLTATTGTVYADQSGAPRSVILVMGTGPVDAPATMLTRAFAGVGEDRGSIIDVHDIAAGSWGGVERCGRIEAAAPVVACGWADPDSIGVGIFVNRPLVEAATMLTALREHALPRS
jgi:hypothetical protein